MGKLFAKRVKSQTEQGPRSGECSRRRNGSGHESFRSKSVGQGGSPNFCIFSLRNSIIRFFCEFNTLPKLEYVTLTIFSVTVIILEFRLFLKIFLASFYEHHASSKWKNIEFSSPHCLYVTHV